MRRMFLSVAVSMAMSVSTQAAQIYKWVDAQGVQHFDSTPPAGQQTEPVDIQRPPLPGSVVTQPVTPGPEEQQRAIDAKVRSQARAEDAKRKENCEAIRTNLAKLKNYSRISEPVEGGYKRLTDEERQARTEETEKLIAQYCN